MSPRTRRPPPEGGNVGWSAAPWEGGIAEDWWEARVSTTLLYLEREGDMPIENAVAVLPVAKNEVYTPKPIL
jgi:hypothetical protein